MQAKLIRPVILAVALVFSAAPALAQQTIVLPPQNIQLNQSTVILTNPSLPETKLNISVPPKVEIQVTTAPAPRKSGVKCGGEGQPRCSAVAAKFEAAAVGNCPPGTFFDIGKWQCWSCPPNHGRSIFAVDGEWACSIPDPSAKGEYRQATYKGPLCGPGTFHDPIRGGECWKCPPGYRRSAAHVEAHNACVIPAREELVRAQRHQRTIWPHDCWRDNRFHDVWDGGNCWTCPAGFNRTGNHINSGEACSRLIGEQVARASLDRKAACQPGEFHDMKIPGQQDFATGGGCYTCPEGYPRTILETRPGLGGVSEVRFSDVTGTRSCEKPGGIRYARAKFVQDLTCPAGQIFDFIGLDENDIRTRPEMKGRYVTPVKSGTCWSCPTAHDRTTAHVKSNEACVAKGIGWEMAPFPEWGLFGFAGAADTLLDVVKRHPQLVKDAIEKAASVAAKSNNEDYNGVLAREKQLFVNSPEKSSAAAAIVAVRLFAAIANPNTASAHEKRLVASFQDYVIKRRTYIAEDALAAYDAWYKADQYWRAKRPPNLVQLFDYGTVPPDFQTLSTLNAVGTTAASTAFGLAAGTLPIVGEVVAVALSAAGNGFADFASPGTTVKFLARQSAEIAIGKAAEFAIQRMAKAAAEKVVRDLVAKGMVQGMQKVTERTLAAAASAGPALILSASMMIASIAIDQVIAITEARPKLVAAVSYAKADPQLARLIQSEQGMTELMGNWSSAVSGESRVPDAWKTQFVASAQSVLGVQQASAPGGINWALVNGAARDIGVGANGVVWHIGSNAEPGGYGIYRLDGGNWTKVPGAAVRIAVDPIGYAWVANSQMNMYRWNGSSFVQVPGLARDIGIGANGTVWHIGSDATPGGFGIYRQSGSGWTKVPGGAVRIAVDPNGNAWVVNDRQQIFRFDGQKFVQMPGAANDIGIGANGSVWVVGANKVAGGYGVYYWDSRANNWVGVPGGLTDIAVGPDGKAWGRSEGMQIYRVQ